MYLSKKFAALPPAERRRIRLLSYSSLTAILLLAALIVFWLNRADRLRQDQDWTEVDFAALPEVDLLRQYLRIDTTPTTGSELAGARFLAERLAALGLEPVVEPLGDNKANIWAILEGRRPEAVVLHSHIDVYPIMQPELWDHDPFAAAIDEAWLYGRGTFDMKSTTIAQLMALQHLIKKGEKTEMSVIFLATGSEEVGSELGTRWILAQHPELARRFDTVLTEGGIVEPVTYEEVKYWGIEFAQKRFVQGWACATNRDRLEGLQSDLAEINEAHLDLRFTPEVERFLASYAASRSTDEYEQILRDTRQAMAHADRFLQMPAYLRSLFRDEVATFPIEEDPEGGYRMRIFLHLLPGSDATSATAALLPAWATHGVSLALEPPLGADHGSPVDDPMFEAIVTTIQDLRPNTPVGPYLLAWSATDSRFYRQAGIRSYGVSPFLIFVTDTFRRDTANERIGLPGYVQGVELYARLVESLAG